MKLNVVEVFDSIQGEGHWMGVYCTFIRLPGCNYACPFCDTDFSKADKVLDTDTTEFQKHVVITGGEPSIHPSIGALIEALHERGCVVHVETNGTVLSRLIGADWITCSPKREEWLKSSSCKPDWHIFRNVVSEYKLVVDELFNPQDWLDKEPILWLQPCDGLYKEESKKRILEIVRTYPRKFRAGIQLHKWYEVV